MSYLLTGDNAMLDRLRAKLTGLASNGVSKVAERAAPQLVDHARAAVLAGTKLDGAPIADTSSTFKRGTGTPLNRSGELAASAQPVINPDSVGVRFDSDHAKYALKDFWPSDPPKEWTDILKRESTAAIGEELHGGQ